MKIGIMGLSANPIHNGHIQLAQSIIDDKILDKVWLMPCYGHNHNKELISANDRFQMCVYACLGLKDIVPNRYEINIEHSGKTYDLINTLLNYEQDDAVYYKREENQLYYIVGLDCANNIDKWYNWEKLINKIPFIVVSRINEQPIENSWYMKSPHTFLQKNIVGVSSSEIRKWIKNGDDNTAKIFLNEQVWNYIQLKGFYK